MVKIKQGRGCSLARVPATLFRRGRAGDSCRRRCRRFWRAERLRRVAGGRYDLFRLICVLGFAQTRERGAAGARLWRRHASGDHGDLYLLRNKIGERVREVRWAEARRVEVRGEDLAHRPCRIWPETPADMRGYGEGFRRPRCGSSREAKGERERMPRAIYMHG
jgi:hypothetical protein